MDRKDEDLLRKLLPMFEIEARDHLRVISSGLIDIDKNGLDESSQVIEVIYRESHSLKGAARSVNRPDIVEICQSLENVFSAMKKGQIVLTRQIMDLLQQIVDGVSDSIVMQPSPGKPKISEIIRRLSKTIIEKKPALPVEEERAAIHPDATTDPEQEKSQDGPTWIDQSSPVRSVVSATKQSPGSVLPSTGTIRVSTAKLDSLLLQAEEMISLKLASSQRALELLEIRDSLVRWKKERAKKRSSKRTSQREEYRGRIDEKDAFIEVLESDLTKQVKAAEYHQRSVAAMVDALLDDMKKTLMLPFSSFIENFPKLVRDLARDAGKQAELEIKGGEIEVDRRVLEEIKDPLIHLVRNCIDHGIENPEERKKKNKPVRGTLKISLSSRNGKTEIEVSDDGAGIDEQAVRSAAEKCSLPGAIAGSEEHDPISMIFRSGVSTSPILTDISGRGLGLAIVREKVNKLNGAISVDTKRGFGTSFRMAVPLTLTTFRGVLIKAAGQLFVLPSANVERVTRVRKEEIRSVENRETLSLDGKTLSLIRLTDILELEGFSSHTDHEDLYSQVAVLSAGGTWMAFIIDEVLQEQEVLVKNLGRQLSRVRNIAGATVLGNGKVVPILNVSDLMASAVKITPTRSESSFGSHPKRTSILVVEDSITSRTLLKTILESAGYAVITAVDGVDAFAALKSGTFDLVVSDVEMPRMNGFDLTAKIRSDRKLSEMPVVLVTALESREDKERGIEVGADAYVVKSSFEQSNLLEVIERLT